MRAVAREASEGSFAPMYEYDLGATILDDVYKMPAVPSLCPEYFLFSYHISVYMRYSRFAGVFFHTNTVKHRKC